VTSTPDPSSIAFAERTGATAQVCEVTSTARLSTSVLEVIVAGDVALAGTPGNDVMIRIKNAHGKFVRRRYSVRDTKPTLGQFSLWVTTGHDGPGSSWAQLAQPGDQFDVIGPRGKHVLDSEADWHLFIGDATGLASFYRIAESIEAPGRAIFIVEIDHPDDALTTTFEEGIGVTGIFVDRQGRAKDDARGIFNGLAALALPPDHGHAYLFGEFHVIKAAKAALLDRGMNDDQLSLKAFWRAGRKNADHGEPDKSED
jgi:NADPH-dependent ferric siderophore reductase